MDEHVEVVVDLGVTDGMMRRDCDHDTRAQIRLALYDLVTAAAGLGDRTEPLAWLEKAYEERCAWLALWLKIDPTVRFAARR